MTAATWDTVADTAITICWGAFAVVWVLGAAYNARRAPLVRRRTTGPLHWVVGIVIAWIALRLVRGSDWHRLLVHAS